MTAGTTDAGKLSGAEAGGRDGGVDGGGGTAVGATQATHAAAGAGLAHPPELALSTLEGRIPGRLLLLWGLLVAVGAAGFAVTVGEDPARAWSTVWSNFLLWTGIAMAGVAFGAVLHTAKGHWGKDFRRVAEGMGAFLPVSFLLLLALLFLGAPHIFPWTGPVEGHVNLEWLTLDGVLWRNVAGVALLYGVCFWYLRLSLRPDAREVAGTLAGWRRGLVERLAGGWRGDREELERARLHLSRLSPALVLLWVYVSTLLVVDMVMSLIPGFLSVIWGPYYFVGGWLGMLCLTALLVAHYRGRHGLEEAWGRWELHDLGKLIFAFSIFWAYMWWSQYLVIWYGNLGRETVFFEQRLRADGGFGAYWLQMVLCFGAPFALLLWRRPKMNPRWLAFVGSVVLAGFWLERHLLVQPSVLEGGFRPGLPEITVSLGFVGLFGLCYSTFASLFPRLPIRETLVGTPGRGP